MAKKPNPFAKPDAKPMKGKPDAKDAPKGGKGKGMKKGKAC